MPALSKVLRAPFEIGAIAPSSSLLARRAIEAAEVRTASRAIELGPGNGVITRHLLDALPEGGKLLALERCPDFSRQLAARYPSETVVCDCASRMESHARAHGFEGCDCIVSALPWSNLPGAVREEVVTAAIRTLRTDGIFVTITCFGLHWLPPGRHLHGLLVRSFDEVSTSPVILANVPPAFLYVCRKRGRTNGRGMKVSPVRASARTRSLCE